jgi:hypothetical protein
VVGIEYRGERIPMLCRFFRVASSSGDVEECPAGFLPRGAVPRR